MNVRCWRHVRRFWSSRWWSQHSGCTWKQLKIGYSLLLLFLLCLISLHAYPLNHQKWLSGLFSQLQKFLYQMWYSYLTVPLFDILAVSSLWQQAYIIWLDHEGLAVAMLLSRTAALRLLQGPLVSISARQYHLAHLSHRQVHWGVTADGCWIVWLECCPIFSRLQIIFSSFCNKRWCIAWNTMQDVLPTVSFLELGSDQPWVASVSLFTTCLPCCTACPISSADWGSCLVVYCWVSNMYLFLTFSSAQYVFTSSWCWVASNKYYASPDKVRTKRSLTYSWWYSAFPNISSLCGANYFNSFLPIPSWLLHSLVSTSPCHFWLFP